MKKDTMKQRGNCMRVDYRKLGQIALNPAYRNQPAKDTSDVLANYLYLMSNLNADVDAWSASEMAMITNSLNRWQDKKTHVYSQNVSVGDILMVDFGLRYAPELSYGHPALVLETWNNLMFVIPATSSSSKLAQAYHPTDNPSGKWYYRKVGASDGFAHDCVLIINNAKTISKTSILSPMGKLTCNLQDETQLFREVKYTLLEHLFHREWAANQNLIHAYDKLQTDFNTLKNAKDAAEAKIHELEQQIKNLQPKSIDNQSK
jgi:hypothetical protein